MWPNDPCSHMYVNGCQKKPCCQTISGRTENNSVSAGRSCWATKTTTFAISSCLITSGVAGGPNPMPAWR